MPEPDGRSVAEFTYSGRTALVTGASRNIGRAIALTLAARGIAVAVNARTSADDADAVRKEIIGSGGRAEVILGDVGTPEGCADVAARMAAALGPVDYLVSNAATRRFQAYEEITPDEWDATIRSNLSALFYLGRDLLPGMRDRGFGRVIAIGGPDGYIGWHHRAANVTAKAGLTGLVKAISFEFGLSGVTANVVVPGQVETTRSAKDYPANLAELDGYPKGRPHEGHPASRHVPGSSRCRRLPCSRPGLLHHGAVTARRGRNGDALSALRNFSMLDPELLLEYPPVERLAKTRSGRGV